MFKMQEIKDQLLKSEAVAGTKTGQNAHALAQYMQTKNPEGGKLEFNTTAEGPHMKLLYSCIEEVQTSAKNVTAFNASMFTSAGIALAGHLFLSSWSLFGIALVPVAAFGLTCALWGLSKSAREQHNKALENLRQCVNWTLGGGNSGYQDLNATQAGEIINRQYVKDMLGAIKPYMTAAQLNDVIDNDIERAADMDAADGENMTYQMLGYQQGGLWAFMKGFFFEMKNAAVSIYQGASTFFNKYAHPSNATVAEVAVAGVAAAANITQ
ncbi:MAG: hypothetical protein NTW94_06320 [Legionellales bacterium]|nr:hypothetical protein [Legionellales bacterium]